jgi:hypothetical protein
MVLDVSPKKNILYDFCKVYFLTSAPKLLLRLLSQADPLIFIYGNWYRRMLERKIKNF